VLVAPRRLDDLVVLDHEPCHRLLVELAHGLRRSIRTTRLLQLRQHLVQHIAQAPCRFRRAPQTRCDVALRIRAAFAFTITVRDHGPETELNRNDAVMQRPRRQVHQSELPAHSRYCDMW
jgi:hypothetical protein